MSLGSHSLRRGWPRFISSNGLPSTTTREPLLFLYPKWIRTAAIAERSQEIDLGNTTRTNGLDPLCHNESVLGDHFLSRSATLESPNYGKFSGNTNRPALGKQDLFSVEAYATENEKEYTEQQVQLLEGGISAGTHLKVKGNTNTVPPSGLTRRILSMKEKRFAQRNYERSTREDYEEIKVRERLTGDIDWRDILATLERRTPNGASPLHDNVVRIKVPFMALGRLLHGEEDNIWAIKWSCGCQIEVLGAEEGHEYRILIITGPVKNISKAAVEIVRVTPGATYDQAIRNQRTYLFSTKSRMPFQSLPANTESRGAIRYVRADLRQRMAAPVRADKIPRPSTWTPDSFGSYVQHLTSIKLTTQIQRTLYKSGEYHIRIVIDILKAIFVDPTCRKAITASAFNDALRYLEKHNAIDVVRDLFVIMEMHNLKMNTETFNIMLRGAAKSRSLGNFQQIFLLILRRGYVPNADTWVAFLRVVDDFGIKSHILKSMKDKELLHDPQTQKYVCETFVEMEINNSLDNNQPQEQFLEYMAGRYGQAWLSKACANRILDALGIRGLISRCWDFIEYMDTQNVKPSNLDIETILHHCEKQRNAEGAIEVIRRMSHLKNLDASQEIYRTLFSIAWNNFLPCVARVVWCHACLNGATTPSMRNRIYVSANRGLSKHSSITGVNSFEQWKEIAGLFVLGLDNSYLKTKTTDKSWDFHVIAPSVQQHTLDLSIITDPGEEERKAVVVQALNMQMQAFRSWTQRVQFADLLVDAFRTDLEWTASGARYEQRCLAWLVERTPTVPLRYLAKSRTATFDLNKI